MAGDTRFELYRLLVEEVRESRRARRELSSAFLTLNLAGVGALGFLAKSDAGQLHNFGLIFWASVALVMTCVIWRTTNVYYTKILGAKYDILYKVELGLADEFKARPLHDEWEAIKQAKAKPDRRFFSLEYAMPALFIVGYLVLVAFQVTPQQAVDIFTALINSVTGLLHGVMSR